MKKIRIDEHFFGILVFIIFIAFLGTFFTSVAAILFGEVATKTSGIIKYSLSDSINIFISSIVIGTIGYVFIKYIEPIKKTNNKTIDFSKCPKCKESYRYETLKDGMCQKCNIKTIEIEEYYKKYPEELDDI